MNLLKKLWKEEEGQALSEYGLILGIVVIAVVGLLGAFKDELVKMFQKITDTIKI